MKKKIKKLRLKLAAFIAGGTLHNFKGMNSKGVWISGPIILTPDGMAAMKACFRTGAKVYVHTVLEEYK